MGGSITAFLKALAIVAGAGLIWVAIPILAALAIPSLLIFIVYIALKEQEEKDAETSKNESERE
jgi:uncharacterized membrane protein